MTTPFAELSCHRIFVAELPEVLGTSHRYLIVTMMVTADPARADRRVGPWPTEMTA
jgi:hypothetical protein